MRQEPEVRPTHCEPALPRELAPEGIDGAIVFQDVDEVQIVALASGKVIGVMCRRDFDSTRSKAHVHQLCVLNDRHLPAVQGMHHKLAMQVLVPVQAQKDQMECVQVTRGVVFST